MSKFRTGDHIHHAPTGEDWVVAYADYERGELAPVGWPDCEAKIADCTLIKAVDDDGHLNLLAELAVSGDRRGVHAGRIAKEAVHAAA